MIHLEWGNRVSNDGKLPSEEWWKGAEEWGQLMDLACMEAGDQARVASRQDGCQTLKIIPKNSSGKGGVTYNFYEKDGKHHLNEKL
jgi:hypothetical protein